MKAIGTTNQRFTGLKKLNLLVGTSGDTGSAAIEAVREFKSHIDICVLYPKGRGISLLQELQMTTVGEIEDKRLVEQTIKTLKEELENLDNQKTQLIGEIDELDNQQDWIDWVGKYGTI